MWSLIAVPGIVFLLCLPAGRRVIGWVFALVYLPVFFKFKMKYRAGPVAQRHTDGSPPMGRACEVTFARERAELGHLGFEPRCVLRFERADGFSLTHVLLTEHPALQCAALVTHSWAFNTTALSTVELVSRHGETTLTTSNQRIAPKALPAKHVIYSLPSLFRAQWLHEVHRAAIERGRMDGGLPMPASEDGWAEWYNSRRERHLRAMAEARYLVRTERQARYALTWLEAFSLTRRSLWPWRQRDEATARRTEEAFLRSLGLERLLKDAELARPGRGAPTAISIPDDHGITHEVANRNSAEGDERLGDPKFRGILSQADEARSRELRPSRRRLATTVAIVACVATAAVLFVKVSVGAGVLVGVVLLLFVGMTGNVGRFHLGEQAAAGVYLRRGLCASCLYSLGSLVPESDDCLVCPECGAAWNKARVQAFTTFHTSDLGDSAYAHGLGRSISRILGGQTERGVAHKDDRGARCILVSPALRAVISAAEPPERERLERARGQIARSGRLFRWGMATILLALFVAPPFLFLFNFGRGPRAALFPMVLSAMMGCWLALGVVRGNFGYNSKKVVRAMLNERLCPSCAESLAGRARTDGGFVECLCGASWRVTPPLVNRTPH